MPPGDDAITEPNHVSTMPTKASRRRIAMFFIAVLAVLVEECKAQELYRSNSAGATIYSRIFRGYNRRTKRSKRESTLSQKSPSSAIDSDDEVLSGRQSSPSPPSTNHDGSTQFQRPSEAPAESPSKSAVSTKQPIKQPIQKPTIKPGAPTRQPKETPTKEPVGTDPPTERPTPKGVTETARPSVSPTVESTVQNPVSPPTTSPSSPGLSRAELIQADLAQVTAESILLDTATPQGQAMKWLINNDPAQLEPTTYTTFRQRYSLVTLYFSTGGNGWTVNSNWLRTTQECSWDKVSCDSNDEVKQIQLGTLCFCGCMHLD